MRLFLIHLFKSKIFLLTPGVWAIGIFTMSIRENLIKNFDKLFTKLVILCLISI
jgi:hypothetical protein